MQTKLVFTSSNTHKVEEVKRILGEQFFAIQSLNDVGFDAELPETSDTFKGNAEQKARYFFEKTNLPCFSDDSGLVVEALNGEPGILSARYAGKQRSDADNVAKLLRNLESQTNRKAYFICVVCLIFQGKSYFFEGKVDGEITLIPKSNTLTPFGYDPIFKPSGFNETFAQMDSETKDNVSHRKKALEAMQKWFKAF